MNVLSVKQNPKKPEQGYAVVVDDTGVSRDAWTPNYEQALKLVESGHAPDGWKLDEGEYGWRFLPPREKKGGGFGGGAAAFRNTKEGFLAEQDNMNRRTAAMQATAQDGLDVAFSVKVADGIYAWLSKTSSGSTGQSIPPGQTADEVRPVSAPRSNPPVQLDEIRVDNRVLNRAYPSAGPGEEPAEARAELVVEGSGDGFCPNYSDHSFGKINGVMACKKCGAVRM